MTFTHEFYLLLCVATLLGFNCETAIDLDAPRNLSHRWLDPFTVNVSWEKPRNLPEGCNVEYMLRWMNETSRRKPKRIEYRNYISYYLTEEAGSGQWEVSVQAIGSGTCEGRVSSPERLNITTRKPRGEVVKDFKCLIELKDSNCSWMLTDPSLNMSLSYRLCGNTKEHLESLKECDHQYSDGIRKGCLLRADCLYNFCVKVETDREFKTFTPKCVIPPPNMSISVSEDGEKLDLKWAPPKVGKDCGWVYQVSYEECGKLQRPLSYMRTKMDPEHGPLQIPYNKHCLYDFKFNVSTNHYCNSIKSDSSGRLTYGTNNPAPEPFRSMILVATILSFVLSIGLVLSCYCARRHSAIICPVIPDPSSIFKEMMINGNKEYKTPRLYTPVSEAIASCNVTPVTDDGAHLPDGKPLL